MSVSRLLGTESHKSQTHLFRRKGDQEVGARRPRRRYNRNVELVLGILVITVVVALLIVLID
jgi:hypothetical protein